jgi:hypothetical protein
MALLEACERRHSDNFAETLRNSLVKEHIAVETSRLRGAQAGFRSFEKIRRSLHDLTADTLSFLMRLELVKVDEERGLVVPTSSKALLRRWKNGQLDIVRRLITQRILSSSYMAYLAFLLNLKRIGDSFTLKAESRRKRGSPLRRQLQNAGFETDVASFYTLRDFFCDLQLVNFGINDAKDTETIFLACEITRANVKPKGFRRSIVVGNRRISYDKRILGSAFCQTLTEGYRTLSTVWGRWVRLLDLRDSVTVKLGITDESFNALLMSVLEGDHCKGFEVEGSAGYAVSRRSYGSIMKSKKMPLMEGGRPVQYVKIAREP